jgi:hypothetical protein
MSAPKKTKLRKNVRLEALDPKYAPRTRKELLDADYLKKLSPEELEWYAQFTDEWAGASVSKTKSGKIKAGYLHNTKELAKDCYDRNNRRNNDVLGVTKANSLLSEISNELNKNDGFYITDPELTEDALIHRIEEKENEDAILSYSEYQKLKHNMTDEMIIFYESIYSE